MNEIWVLLVLAVIGLSALYWLYLGGRTREIRVDKSFADFVQILTRFEPDKITVEVNGRVSYIARYVASKEGTTWTHEHSYGLITEDGIKPGTVLWDIYYKALELEDIAFVVYLDENGNERSLDWLYHQAEVNTDYPPKVTSIRRAR